MTGGATPAAGAWANYSLHPVACARLIVDYAEETSGTVRTRLLQATGLDARWVCPPCKADLQQGESSWRSTSRNVCGP
ncbi:MULTISPECIES: hypothetical protein [Streptomyces albovinaceus subgroup]|uniref:hypothetical protein n=1 Tax=Streptomyces albovinaceus subgroup TaxID=1482558 RepID=UPI00117FE268|nr:hypothetical protein [Streptomyces albovinaceus]GGW17649.1 hypothetical protein GCM10010264_74090 [Streptomyces globisporus]